MRTLCYATACIFALGLVAPLAAQRGGGGGPGGRRPPEIDERVGAWFVTLRPEDVGAAQPTAGTGKAAAADLLSPLPFVVAAAGKQHRSVVYLCDPTTDADKHAQFERMLFTDDVGVALRLFECARIDVTAASAQALRARYGKQVPLVAVFGADGKPVGELAMAGYKAAARELVDLLDQGVGKANKLALPQFVKQYKDVVRDLEQLLQKQKLLDERDKKIDADDKQKRAAIEQERKELAAQLDKVTAAEKDLLGKIDMPPRPEGAERIGRGPRRR